MENHQYKKNNNGRIKLEPKLRTGTGYHDGDDVFQDEELEVSLFSMDKFIKKNAIRVIVCVAILTMVYSIKSLPFSVTQKVTQGVKWSITHETDLNGISNKGVVPTISNQIKEWVNIGEEIEQGERETEVSNTIEYTPPVEGIVTSPFEDQIHPVFETKIEARGIEISTEPASDIYAIDKGKVVNIQEGMNGGKKITIEHENLMKSVYEGCYESPVKLNDEVKQGELLGKTETTIEGEMSLLYFELWKEDKAVNPLDYMDLEVDTAS